MKTVDGRDYYSQKLVELQVAQLELANKGGEEALKIVENIQRQLVGLDAMRENVNTRSGFKLPDAFAPKGIEQ